MKKLFIPILMATLLMSLFPVKTNAMLTIWQMIETTLSNYRAQGYTCYLSSHKSRYTVDCERDALVGYSAYSLSDYKLQGYKTQIASAATYSNTWNSPFVYLHNPPNGTISLSLTSPLGKYLPEPAFNQENGWLVHAANGKISVDGNEQKYLFYELAVHKILLSRNGKNFTSKDEVKSYLLQSDFLSKMGFSEAEKKNSLDYFLPKLDQAPTKKFYYLTILDNASAEALSQLDIHPKPQSVHLKYFAVYPSNVQVATQGGFVFPDKLESNPTDYTVDVTGEFLVDPSIMVFWNK